MTLIIVMARRRTAENAPQRVQPLRARRSMRSRAALGLGCTGKVGQAVADPARLQRPGQAGKAVPQCRDRSEWSSSASLPHELAANAGRPRRKSKTRSPLFRGRPAFGSYDPDFYFRSCQRVFFSILRCLCLDAFFLRHFWTEPIVSPPFRAVAVDRYAGAADSNSRGPVSRPAPSLAAAGSEDAHIAAIPGHFQRLGLDGRAAMTSCTMRLRCGKGCQDTAVLHNAMLDPLFSRPS
jgi:hypothetical protein